MVHDDAQLILHIQQQDHIGVREMVKQDLAQTGQRRTPLIEAMDNLRRGRLASVKCLVHILKKSPPDAKHHRWGDTAIGGSLGALELAVDVGSPALVKRCIQRGCELQERGHTLAWRSGKPEVILLLERHFGKLRRPWEDQELEDRLKSAAAEQQRKELDTQTAQATGKRGDNGRL